MSGSDDKFEAHLSVTFRYGEEFFDLEGTPKALRQFCDWLSEQLTDLGDQVWRLRND